MSEDQQNPPTERDASAPEQPQSDSTTVHLPTVIADEFGISRSEARMMCQIGEVTIDGEKIGPVLDIEHEKIQGKTVRVGDSLRTVQFVYDGDARRDRFTGDRFA